MSDLYWELAVCLCRASPLELQQHQPRKLKKVPEDRADPWDIGLGLDITENFTAIKNGWLKRKQHFFRSIIGRDREKLHASGNITE